jgi:nuclear transport factor 2 (NTF2) superfamily protein
MGTKKECSCNKAKIEVIKRMNNINTFQAHENEICLRGTDEYGKDFTVWWDSYDFLNWIDEDNLEYIKEQLIKHIKKI